MLTFITSIALPPFKGTFLSNWALKSTNRSHRPYISKPYRLQVVSALSALIFDCDGVLADTERDAHRVAFNLAFEQMDLQTIWDEKLYGNLLQTGGGKERMTAYWNQLSQWPQTFETDQQKLDLVNTLHTLKTNLFMQLVQAGKVPLREGVERLVNEAINSGVQIAVCSTSNEKAVSEIVQMLGDAASSITIFAGDVVDNKKPSPDIYNLAAKQLQLDPTNVCVIEDSYIGVKAARAAGMPVVVTKSTYTGNEDFSEAQKVCNSLEDPRTSLQDLTTIVEAFNKSVNQRKSGIGRVGQFRPA